MIRVELANQQSRFPIDKKRLRDAVRAVLAEEGHTDAEISLAVVDDPTIHDVNRRFLQHDYPTDVISFRFSEEDEPLAGEVIVSADTAARCAIDYGWSTSDELLLYVIHGTLHIAGYDDHEPDDLAAMRAQERAHLARFGLTARY